MKMLEVIDAEHKLVLVRPDAVDAIYWQEGSPGRLVLVLRSGHHVKLRDDYGHILMEGGPYGDAIHMLGIEVQRMDPAVLYTERENRLNGRKV